MVKMLQLPDPNLLVPIRFHHFISSGSAVDKHAIEASVAKQLGVANQALKGSVGGCNGKCVDTHIRLLGEGCESTMEDCQTVPVQVCSRRAHRNPLPWKARAGPFHSGILSAALPISLLLFSCGDKTCRKPACCTHRPATLRHTLL
jgi:hypothetical protein